MFLYFFFRNDKIILEDYSVGNFNIRTFLKQAVKTGASDVHLHVGERPVLRKDGKMVKIDMDFLDDEDLERSIMTLLPSYDINDIKKNMDLDFSYELPAVSRFRVNLSRQLGHFALTLRLISFNIRQVTELNLPSVIQNFADLNNGIVLVTGPTGSGKSTTLASINVKYPKHIITVEDPIEYMFSNKLSIISQRQVEIDTSSFNDGIKYALRQDPDVILIGEIRDRDTANAALKAAETGHLVLASLHTNDATQTINRIINMFDPQDRDLIRDQLANTIRGIIAQKLVKVAHGSGRRPIVEIMISTPTIKDYIIKNKLDEIYDIMRTGSDDMVTMNASLFNLLREGVITQEYALEASDNKNEFNQMLRGVFRGTENQGNNYYE